MNIIDPYDKKAVRLANAVSTFGVLLGLAGWWFSREYTFFYIGMIIIGFQAVYFSHDLAMEWIVRYKDKYDLNYRFYRGAYVVVGLVFMSAGIFSLIVGQ